MNVRIDEDGIRFRIIPAELEELLRDNRLERGVTLGSRKVSYEITPMMSGEMALDLQDMRLNLLIPQRLLKELQDLGRSKKGISVRQENIEVALQVDLKIPPVKP